MSPETIKVIIVIATVAIVQFVKKVLCKEDPKYKPLYVFGPIVLCSVAFLVMALIQKTDVWSALLAGASLGLTCMGSFDLLVGILEGWKDKTPTQLVEEVEKVIKK